MTQNIMPTVWSTLDGILNYAVFENAYILKAIYKIDALIIYINNKN